MKSCNSDDTNLRQKEFYDTKKKNFATTIWSYFRNGLLNQTRKNIGVDKQILDLHVSWFGDISTKKVLDLGCYEGNSLSYFLAKNSKEYVAIDLSEKAIDKLSKKIENIPTAKAIAIDFLSSEFTEKNFDLIYAYGVLHHFKDLHLLVQTLKDKLSSRGEIVSYDPLETSIPVKFLRQIYRPFQTDKDWEWPFSRKVYYFFSGAFNVKERRAILGRSKWFFILEILPISSKKKIDIARNWHQNDWEKSQISDSSMFDCMHLTMLLQKKE